ncbi:21331_t:CDS:2 [Cetraspora pellucida]|uniref:21331_t:CDS:1 n=1 Tax=Cetraspora pellucida TaxID=1433469 RepID=A0A9N9J220_9GLOM|nr:21331_t:CDS:2 [Cetraspora pellucida]
MFNSSVGLLRFAQDACVLSRENIFKSTVDISKGVGNRTPSGECINFKRLYQLFDDKKNEDDKKKLSLIYDIMKLVQERELKRRKDQSIKVGPSEQEIVFKNKDGIYDNIITEYKTWFFHEQIKTKEYYSRFFELIKEKKNEDNYSKLCKVNDFETMVNERELKRLDIAKKCLNNINNFKKIKKFGI